MSNPSGSADPPGCGSTAAAVGLRHGAAVVDSSAERPQPPPFIYRPDIDGLRGVAVLAVILFHLDRHALAGGFTGVDVFFVISGYVVCGSLLRHSQPSFGAWLGSFYLRRLRRLLPNLLLSLGVTALGVALLIPPQENRAILLTGIKALYGWSNNHLAADAHDYFAASADLNPFVHTWSLGVEEQFYLVFPLLLWAIGCRQAGAAGVGRRRLAVLLSLIAASLTLSWFWSATAPSQAFFLMPSRFWEMALGAALLLAQQRGWPAPGQGRAWLLPFGALLLGIALLFTPERGGFPAPAALPAVLGTLALLQAGPGPGGRFLPWRPVERALLLCGLLSYSLYLWHWPVVVFLRWTWGLESLATRLAALVLTALLAFLAYRFLEEPVRRNPLPPLHQLLLAVALLGATWGGMDALANGQKGRLFLGSRRDPIPRAEQPWGYAGADPTHPIDQGPCVVEPFGHYGLETAVDPARCRRPGLPGMGELLLLGDSHAQALLPLFDAVTLRRGQALGFRFKSGCLISSTLTGQYIDGRRYEPCRQFAATELELARRRLAPGDGVVIVSWLNRYLSGLDPAAGQRPPVFDRAGQRLDLDQARRAWVEDLRGWAAALGEKGIHLILLVDVPVLSLTPVVCDSWTSLPGHDPRQLCSPPAALTARMQESQRRLLEEVARGHANVHLFDPTPLFLAGGRVRHRLADGTPLYVDDHHVSRSASRLLETSFSSFLRQVGLRARAALP